MHPIIHHPKQIVAVSARERCTLLPVDRGGAVLAPQAPGASKAHHSHLALRPGLQPLHFELAALLHRAGARPDAPAWDEDGFAAAWQAAQADGTEQH